MPNQIARHNSTNKTKNAIAPFGVNFSSVLKVLFEFSKIIFIALITKILQINKK